ncbi:hypothetical protein Mgra_00009622 [Meloidogyne graminicola]|uniref:DNA-directed DNA polymerase n=1 Tax=Meloidogyne graminicola TaxID=189291 RepID=A0A8S9ZD16_9BILA|nr:hypothetical protein Mgra_00009622 [Meloidogyne graminicola]
MSHYNGSSASKRPRAGDQNLNKYYRQIDYETDYSRKFKMMKTTGKFIIEKISANPEELLRKIIQKCMDLTIKESKNKSIEPEQLGALISSQLLDNDIWIPIRKIEKDTIDNILTRFQLVSQSKIEKGSLLGQPFTIILQTLGVSALPKNATIRGRAPQQSSTLNIQINENRLIKINNQNNLCLFYALEVTRKYATKELGNRLKFSRYLNYKQRQMEDVFSLLKAAKIPSDLPEYDAIEFVPIVVDFWNNQYKDSGFKFKVFVFGADNENPKFKYGSDNFNLPISIYHSNNHFDGIRNVGGLYDYNNRYCFECEKRYKKAKEHDFRCKARCHFCGRIGSDRPCVATVDFFRKFDDCGKKYLNEDCFKHHKASSNCRQTKQCEKCGVIWSLKNYKREVSKKHICGQKWCQICKQYHSMDRGCFIRPLELKKEIMYRLVTFDFEATQNEIIREIGKEEKRLHKVNFIAATVTCTKCMENDQLWRSPLKQNGKSCEICGRNRSITFSHQPFKLTKVDEQRTTETPLKDFVRWILFELNPQYITMAFSHFGGRYDMVMTFKEIYLAGIVPSMIRRGNKLYELKVPRNKRCNEVIFRDSFNLCPVALGKLVGAFGLKITEKQFFPHLANISENYGKILPQLPSKEDYIYGGMNTEKQIEFDKWYEEEKNNQFCLDEALAEYCTNDVQILTEALIAFRKKFREISKQKNASKGIPQGIDILRDAMTIASACMKHFRLNHLKPEHLAIVPEKGYDTCDNQSELAMKYLQWYEESRGIKGGEHQVGNYKVDGYIEEEDRAIEVNGCVWHACKNCFGDNLDKILPNGKTVGETRENDEKRLSILRKNIKNVDVIWECEIHKMLRRYRQMRKAFANYHDKGPIKIRDCYFGGRTGPAQLYFDADKEQHKIAYLDFNSLYPSTIATTSFPVGHPKLHIVPFDQQRVNWTKKDQIPFKGILKVFIIPLPRLDVPVIPVKFDDRLLFPLCRKCSITYPNGANIKEYCCPHNDEERGWVSTCTSIELEEALQVGYRVSRFYRALHYDQWDDQLFKNYVAEFMAMKIHASGYPEGIIGKENEDKFMKECKERFGIEVQREKMIPDKAMRYISKLMLNSLWGRFSLRNTLSKSVVTDSPYELREYATNNSIEIQSIDKLTEETILITYKPKDEFIIEHETSNIVISLWTTSAARIRLLKAMQKVAESPGCNILYGDTDSILFSHPKDIECPLQTGPHLGDLAREYVGSAIKEYVGGACKAYGLRMESNKNAKISTALKVRGITLTVDVCKILHFESFKKSVLQYANGEDEEDEKENNEGIIMVENSNFLRPSIKEGGIYSTKMKKMFRPIIQKVIPEVVFTTSSTGITISSSRLNTSRFIEYDFIGKCRTCKGESIDIDFIVTPRSVTLYCNRMKSEKVILFDIVYDIPQHCVFRVKAKGKSYNIIHDEPPIIEPPPKEILYCYGEYNSLVPILQKFGISVYSGVPPEDLIKKLAKPALVILDDLMYSIEEKYLSELFTKKSHHLNFGIVFVTQNLFEKKLKVARQNSMYIVLARAPNSALAIRNLGVQLFPGKLNYFLDAYRQSTRSNYSYLFIDLHPSSDNTLRLRTNIFKEESNDPDNIPKRKKILRKATVDQLLAITEVCLNIVRNHFSLTKRQKLRLFPFADFVRRVSRVRTERGARHAVVQKGSGLPIGFFPALLTPIIIEIAKNLV